MSLVNPPAVASPLSSSALFLVATIEPGGAEDISIGYSSHSGGAVELCFQEAFTFRVLTVEAAVAMEPPAGYGGFL